MPSLDVAEAELRDAAAEQAWWDEHYDELIANHRDQFVAVKDGVVVGAAPDLSQLIMLLSTKNIDISDAWVGFVTEDHSKLLL